MVAPTAPVKSTQVALLVLHKNVMG